MRLFTCCSLCDLVQEGAIVARMSAVEEMAGMDILCSDKTGTLTLNELTVDKPNVLVVPPGMTVEEVGGCNCSVFSCLLRCFLLPGRAPVDLVQARRPCCVESTGHSTQHTSSD